LAIAAGPLPASRAAVPGGRVRPTPDAERVLAALVAWCVLEIAVGIGVGAIGRLDLPTVLVAEAILFLAGLRLGRIRAPAPRPSEALGYVTIVAIVGLVVVGGTLLLDLAWRPITDHDSLAYHLPAVARFVQTGTLGRIDRVGPSRGYPYGWEVLATLFVLPFRDDFLVAAPNLIAWMILALGIQTSARRLGASAEASWLAAFLVAALPVVRRLVPTLHVDLAVGAFFAAALAFLLGYRDERDPRHLVLFGAALALLCATKTSGLVYAIVALATGTAVGAARVPRRDEAIPMVVAVLAVAAVAVGTFWPLRNVAELGNPLGVVRISIGGVTLFPGTIDPGALRRTTLAAIFSVTSPAHWSILLDAIRQEFGLAALLLVAGALAWRPWRVRSPSDAMVLTALVATTVAVYWMTPYGGDNGEHGWRVTSWVGQALRYALPAVAVLAVVAALGASEPVRRLGTVAAVATVVVLAGTTTRSTPYAALLAAGVTVVATRRTRGARNAAVVLGVIVVLLGSAPLRARRALERARAYDGVSQFVADHVADGDAIGCLLGTVGYPLYGAHFETRVEYVPRATSTRDAWLAELRGRRVTFLALGPLGMAARNRSEVKWLTEERGPFSPVFGDDPGRELVIYGRRRDSAAMY